MEWFPGASFPHFSPTSSGSPWAGLPLCIQSYGDPDTLIVLLIGQGCTLPVRCIIAYCVTDLHRLHHSLILCLVWLNSPLHPNFRMLLLYRRHLHSKIALYRLTPSSIHIHILRRFFSTTQYYVVALSTVISDRPQYYATWRPYLIP